jgi:hypothetical protein
MNTRTVLSLVVVTFSPLAAPAAEITFNRDIRPILSENCFACHGFDAKKRKAELRLDVAEGAFAEHDGIAAIKPKDVEQSELWVRINSDDPNEVMPPPSTKKKLTDKQKETLKQWIEQGAKYQQHWAFEAPVRPDIPLVKNEAWPRNPIDRFILARLESEGLSPRGEAPKDTLIRRVAFALTGLPPTPAEIAEYEADTSPLAYENMVDRYLQSPHFGEEMARHWLDVARYADTHGLHLDNERTMWAYRDWVIDAFNENKPFDAFTVEQLAGDLLPNPTKEQLVATGFNRCNVTTSEGGSIEAEFVYRYAVDRTSTMIQAWMGLTGGCAVCHDHKYDPLTMKEFYSLYAFFYSAAAPAMDRNINVTDPFYKIATNRQKIDLAGAKARETEARRLYDETASRVTYADPAAQEPPPLRRPVEDVWLDDVFPQGSKVSCSSRNASIWEAAPNIDPPRGRRALKQASASKYQDKFDNPLTPLVVPDEARLSAWVRIDEYEPPQALLLELTFGKETRRVLWGDPQHFGGKKEDKTWLGEIPTPGRWTKLEIPAEKLGLKAGDEVRSVALAQFGGVAWWGGLAISGTIEPARDERSSFSLWWKNQTGTKDTSDIPSELATVLKEGPDKNPPAELREKLLRFYLANIARAEDPELNASRLAWLDAQSARAMLAR